MDVGFVCCIFNVHSSSPLLILVKQVIPETDFTAHSKATIVFLDRWQELMGARMTEQREKKQKKQNKLRDRNRMK